MIRVGSAAKDKDIAFAFLRISRIEPTISDRVLRRSRRTQIQYTHGAHLGCGLDQFGRT